MVTLSALLVWRDQRDRCMLLRRHCNSPVSNISVGYGQLQIANDSLTASTSGRKAARISNMQEGQQTRCLKK